MKMKIGVSTLLYEDKDIVTSATKIAKSGVKRIELFCELAGFYPGEVTDETFDALASLAKDYGLTYSIHPPCTDLNPASSDPSERARVIEAYLGTVELATRLGIRDMVVHSGFKSDPDVPNADAFDFAGQTLQTVGKTTEQAGIVMLLENTCWGATDFLDTPQDLVALADLCPPTTKLLLDVGHAVIWGMNPTECARIWLPRLAQIHAHDNHGEHDEHLELGKGIIDWRELLCFLKAEHWDGIFMMEVVGQEDPEAALARSLDLVKTCLGNL
ncbi:MAG: sugar phosphate isomerase/epimerase [Firmicutes bacterium]|nr:sugar phosphate isomerase/epimerase [Bacillota bacterium]